jgi:hypothetical protein
MKNFAISLWLAQVLAAIAMLIAVIVDIEYILVTGPILAAIGLLLALAMTSIQSWSTLTFALSAPFVAAFISLLIAVFELGPTEARTPAIVVLISYLILIWPIAFMSFLRIVRWRTVANRANRPIVQFSLKTLLIVMTATCLLIAAGKLLFDTMPADETYMFGGFTLLVFVLSGGVVWKCLAYPYRGKKSDSSPRRTV